tara:strand:- start:12661 stop:13371 length:711 start_codon:yes stop_codon:yes gene_type:complete
VIVDNNQKFETSSELELVYGVSTQEIDEWKTKWEPEKKSGKNYGYVTYKVVNESQHFPDSKFEDKALTIALRQWGLRTKEIRFKRIRGDSRADIEMKFAKKEDDKFFRDRPATLAYAYFPTKNVIGGDITFNDSVVWSIDGKSVNAHKVDPVNYPSDTKTKIRTYNIIHTLLHECGHAIGLKHCPNHKTCIMYPYYNGGVVLHDHDVERIQKIYGKRNIGGWIISYFRDRMGRKYT